MKKRVVFLHPDLGIGGAERAMIDMAVCLQSSDYSVRFLTPHHDPNHCFEETRDGTIAVTVSTSSYIIPRCIFNCAFAFCAYLRMILAAVLFVLFDRQADLLIVDQVSAPVPLLRLFRYPVLFYCHFPDQLLCTDRTSLLKKVYRFPLDWIEEWSTRMSNKILVNSNFTGNVVKQCFPSLSNSELTVLYPVPNFDSLDITPEDIRANGLLPSSVESLFVSLNRYERKKNIGLAIRAFHHLLSVVTSDDLDGMHLVVAGGYDERVTENVEHHLELVKLAEQLGVPDKVTFVRNCSAAVKVGLLRQATALLYTPENEHFGIVPVEAQYLTCPVVACDSGGPLETVKSGTTGYLCASNPAAFATAMLNIMSSTAPVEMKTAARSHVIRCFSNAAFSRSLHAVVSQLT